MNTIGNFKQDGDRFTGTINTLRYTGAVVIEPTQGRKSEDAPDFQILAGRNRVELGAAWKERSERGTYLSVRLDEPSFSAPIFCRLVQFDGEEAHRLVWSRN